MSNRREVVRLRCDLDLVDETGKRYRLRNFGLEGLRYSGPMVTGDLHMLFIELPNQEPRLRLTARPVWMQRTGPDTYDVGARLECTEEDRRRLNFLIYALADNQTVDDVRWVPFKLVEDEAELETLPGLIGQHRIGGIAGRAAELCAEISPRPHYLWQWAYEAIRRTTLSSVSPELFDAAVTLKLCSAIFFTAIDDVADELRDREFFQQIVDKVFGGDISPTGGGPVRDRQIRNLRSIYRFLLVSAQRMPRYAELARWLQFDHATVLHGMAYSLLANSFPQGICAEEQELWNANSFFMLIFGDIDLMCSPDFDIRELGAVREVIQEAQAMCAISNWLGTWEREFRSGDYSSGVFGTAIKRHVITAQGLTREDLNEVISEKIRRSDVESFLLARWEKHWRVISASQQGVAAFDVARYLRGLEHVYRMQVASRGLI